MMIKYLKVLALGMLIGGCKPMLITQITKSHQSANLVIQSVADHVYQHTSYLDSESFGKVPCNGMIVFDKKEAIIFDAPADNATSRELIRWVEEDLGCKIKAIIPTHFHQDCLGGLEAFHQRRIPSYAHKQTIQLARAHQAPVPQHGFDDSLALKAGREKVLAAYLGPGHTQDNVVGYFPAGKVLFGGCLIKETGAGKGNLADAQVQAWPLTVEKLKARFPATRVVVPGHGKPGGMELLDYTIGLFRQN